jgi:hypothetical protein
VSSNQPRNLEFDIMDVTLMNEPDGEKYLVGACKVKLVEGTIVASMSNLQGTFALNILKIDVNKPIRLEGKIDEVPVKAKIAGTISYAAKFDADVTITNATLIAEHILWSYV